VFKKKSKISKMPEWRCWSDWRFLIVFYFDHKNYFWKKWIIFWNL